MPIATNPLQEAPSVRARLVCFLVLAVLVALCYGHTATAFFVADDYNILAIVSTATDLREATGIAAGWEFFRPLTAVTYWATYLIFGLDPVAFHVFDLCLHVANAWLVAELTWLLLPSRFGAAAAGACFALFPTHPECVTWIAGRFDVLCVTGCLLSMNGWWRFLYHGGGTRTLVRTGVGLVIALLAKDTGMILPVLLLFLAIAPAAPTVPGPRKPWRRRAAALIGVFVVFTVYLAVRLYVLGGFGGYQGGAGSAHLRLNLPGALEFVRDAFMMMLLPGVLPFQGFVTLTLVFSLGAARGNLRTLARFWPWLACVLLAMLPAANTVVLHTETGENTRFLYLPAVFACAGLGLVAGSGVATRARKAILIGLLGSYGISTHVTNQHWQVAGAQAETIVTQLREFTAKRDYQYLFVHGLPDRWHGAFVFRNGFEAALELFVSASLRFPPNGRVSRADWERHASERRVSPNAHPESLLVAWRPDLGRLIEP